MIGTSGAIDFGVWDVCHGCIGLMIRCTGLDTDVISRDLGWYSVWSGMDWTECILRSCVGHSMNINCFLHTSNFAVI